MRLACTHRKKLVTSQAVYYILLPRSHGVHQGLVVGATDYWLQFKWHGLAWLPDTPDVEQLLVDTSDDR